MGDPARRPGDVTGLLLEWSAGDPQARDKLLPLVYDELRRLARQFMRRERADHTLQATALVHEAFVRLVDQSRVEWRNSLHFTALAAQMMRRILVDHAREKGATKRGGDLKRLPLDESADLGVQADPDLLELDGALDDLAQFDPELSRVVELRFFGGLGNEAIAELLGVSVPTVVRRWRLARAWLYDRLGGKDPGPAS